MRAYTLTVLLVLFVTPSAPALPPPSTANVARLIKALGSPSFLEREASSKALEQMGERALPALEKAAKDAKDTEVTRRAKRLVEVIKRSPFPQYDRRLFGTWEVVNIEQMGRPVGPQGRCQLVLVEESFQFEQSGAFVGTRRGRWQVTGKGAVDFTFELEGYTYNRQKIYRLERDTLLLCYNPMPFEARPVEFKTNPGATTVLMTLKKAPEAGPQGMP